MSPGCNKVVSAPTRIGEATDDMYLRGMPPREGDVLALVVCPPSRSLSSGSFRLMLSWMGWVVDMGLAEWAWVKNKGLERYS